ncbi:hypothetical protein C0992_006046 [Termitomyces sp. T32_za158]|nr:hypothetical protein C0992_006046 [Termitomyces sp. T32_za158]
MSTPSSAAASPPSTPKVFQRDPFATPTSSRPSSRPQTTNSSVSGPSSSISHAILNLPTANVSARFSAAAVSGYSIRPASSTVTQLKKLPRMRSHMLPEGEEVSKPWTEKPSSHGMLHIVPTLTSDNIGPDAVFNGTIYNITDCTFNITQPDKGFIWRNGKSVFDTDGYTRACSAISNATAGTVINPVQSARISTRFSASIRYGKIEVRAKMPSGFSLRTLAIERSVIKREIDIVESRGNGIRYTARWVCSFPLRKQDTEYTLSGANYVQGSLNWGPAEGLDGVDKSYSWWSDKRKPFSDGFHTYSLEWTDSFLYVTFFPVNGASRSADKPGLIITITRRISVDTRLHTLLDMRFNEPFFKRGDFPPVIFNGSSLAALQNPWINGTNATPFDQGCRADRPRTIEFYLIMNVAVGSTNGWFPEGQGNKPWLDHAQNPMRDFAKAESQWYPTWPKDAFDRGMIVFVPLSLIHALLYSGLNQTNSYV